VAITISYRDALRIKKKSWQQKAGFLFLSPRGDRVVLRA
jgi:hypothetical protein